MMRFKLGRGLVGAAVVLAGLGSPTKAGADVPPVLTIDRHPRFGTAALVRSAGGRVSPPASGSPVDIAKKWVLSNRGLFDMAASTGLRVSRDGELTGTGMRAIVFRQIVSGLPTTGGGVIGVNVARDGSIVTVWADVGPTRPIDNAPGIDALAAADVVRKALDIEAAPAAAGVRPGDEQQSFFTVGDVRASARLAVLPKAAGPALVWRIFLPKGPEEVYSAAVDAKSGTLEYLRNRVKHAEGLVFRNYPGAAKGGTQETVSFDGDPAASPQGWVGPAPTTAGNNVLAFNDVVGIQRTPPNKVPLAPGGTYSFPYQGAWAAECSPPAPGVENPSYLRDLDVSTTNLFYLANSFHDLAYKLGFTEEMGNYQLDNFGKGGRGGDPIEAAAMSGIATGSINNAFFIPSPDGGEPISADGSLNFGSRTAMFLWRPDDLLQFDCADGSLDAQVVWHELAHGLTTRLAGGPDDADSLFSVQGGAMGEGWSDWFALHFLHQLGLESDTVLGAYVAGNPETGLRHFAAGNSPLTFGDFGFGFLGPEVHDDGEIWTATLWELREALIRRHGATLGAERAGHLVFDALVLAGLPNPTFLQQRDAILQADKLRYGGADEQLIWHVFARRGMGVSAKTTGPDDPEPQPAFDRPGEAGSIRGVVRDADTGATLPGVAVAIGLGEGAPTPVAVTDDLGQFSIKAVPGRYSVTYRASGYGLRHGDVVSATPGPLADVRLARNVASASWGAKVVGGAAPEFAAVALVDDDDTTGPTATLHQPATVRLAGDGPLPVTSVQVGLRFNRIPEQFPPIAYTVELSADGNTWQTVRSVSIPRRKPVPNVTDVLITEARLPAPVPAMFARVTPKATALPAASEPMPVSVTSLEVFASAPGLAPVPISPRARVENGSVQDPVGLALVNPTLLEAACAALPEPVQGLDAWITPVAEEGDGTYRVRLEPLQPDVDLDVLFYDAQCAQIGTIATAAGAETGPVPPGTAWIATTAFSGGPAEFKLHLTSSLRGVRFGASASPAEPATGVLAVTGASDRAPLVVSAMLLGAALAIRRRRSGAGRDRTSDQTIMSRPL